MLQRVLSLSAFVSVLFITLLFGFVLKGIGNDIESDKMRSQRFIMSSAAIAVNSVQDEISNIFKDFSINSKEISKNPTENIEEIRNSFVVGNYRLNEFSNTISSGTIIDLNRDKNFYSMLQNDDIMERFGQYIIRWDSLDHREMIYINNFHGFMVFPIAYDEEGVITRIIYFNFQIEDAIRKYLPVLIKRVMSSSHNEESDRVDFNIEIETGENLKDKAELIKNDLEIDLNRFFNISRINDYYDSRLDREFAFFESNHYYIDNHLYLMVNHNSGNSELYFRSKYRKYFLGLILFYITVISAILTLFYTTYRIRMNLLREKEFTSLISHELKTPLSVIKLGSDNLAAGVIHSKDDVKSYGEMMQKETRRLKDMIENILMISTASVSNQYKVFNRVEIAEIIDSLNQQSFNLLKELDVKIDIVNSSSGRYISCNKSTLVSAIFNVIQNSIRYGAIFSEDRVVKIIIEDTFKRKKEGISFYVIDHGPGINRNDAQKIFKPFYRGQDILERQISGSGLGLSISRKFISQHRGSIHLVKNLRKETVFEIWIPTRMDNEKNTDD